MYEYNQRDAPRQWADYLNDVTDVTSDAFLGMSMGCARCHDHKFDPILQADYFRLQAFFTPLLPRNDLPLATRKQKEDYEAALRKWEQKTATLRAEIESIEVPVRESVTKKAVGKFPPEIQPMMLKPASERTPFERQVAYLVDRQVDEELQKLDDKVKGKEKERLTALRQKLAEFDADKPKPPPVAFVATDVGPVAPPTVIPGDAEKRALEPGYLAVLEKQPLAVPAVAPTATSTGRRRALAKWVTQPQNPLTTRVIANRVWQWHFGRGIVRTSSDFGRLGERPTHPELLDWLAKRFVNDGWSFKKMHRLIVTSATYRQASLRAVPEAARLKDPENRWLWRMTPRRLEAEQIRDAMLAVSGEMGPELDHAGGPSSDLASPRRTIYTKVVRNNRDPLLETFDAPESFGSIATRNETTTATQSLLMVNGDWPLKRATAFAARVQRDAGSSDPAALAETAYRLAYGRPPSAEERRGRRRVPRPPRRA